MNLKQSITAVLLLASSATVAEAAPASTAVSPVATILNSVPVLGSTLTGVVGGVVGSTVSVVPVIGPPLGNVLGAPSLPGLPNLTRVIDQVPVAGAILSNLLNITGAVVVGVPVLGPTLGGMLNGSTDSNGALAGLPSATAVFGDVPVVGPLLQGRLLGGQLLLP